MIYNPGINVLESHGPRSISNINFRSFMAGKSAGISERSDCCFRRQDFAMGNVSLDMVISRVISAFQSRQIQCHIYLTSYFRIHLTSHFPEFLQGNIGS